MKNDKILEREDFEASKCETGILYTVLLVAMFVLENVNDNTVQAANEYARRLIAVNKDVPAWVGALQGVTDDCDREEAARYAGSEFCWEYMEEEYMENMLK